MEKKKTKILQNKKPLMCNTLVFVNSLTEVDTTNQTFQVDFEFHFVRELSKLETISYVNNPNTFEPWIPFVKPLGAQETISKTQLKFTNGKTYYISYNNNNNNALMRCNWLFNVVFTEVLELKNFPFDVQHFDIKMQIDYTDLMRSTYLNNNIDILDLNLKKCTFWVPNYSASLIGWNFEDNCCLQLITDPYGSSTENPFVLLSHIFALRREWQFYITRVVIILSIISFLTNLVFVFGEGSVGEQFGFISTMLLAAVAYVFIVTDYIPNLKYFTLLDYYIYFTFFYILIVSIEIGVVSVIGSTDFGIEYIEYIIMGADFVLWLIVHLIFLISSRRAYKIEKNKIYVPKNKIDVKPKFYTISGEQSNDVKWHTHMVVNQFNKKVYPQESFVRSKFKFD